MPEKKADTDRGSLAKELRSLIPQLDSEGLAFLVEQARIHLYNMQVEQLNRTEGASDARSKPPAGKKAGPGGSGAAKENSFRIDGTESGSSYYIHYRNDEVMFSRLEMIRLVKIANSPGTDLEIRERLYSWFDRERRDAFAVLPISGRADVSLKILAGMIKKTLKLRK